MKAAATPPPEAVAPAARMRARLLVQQALDDEAGPLFLLLATARALELEAAPGARPLVAAAHRYARKVITAAP